MQKIILTVSKNSSSQNTVLSAFNTLIDKGCLGVRLSTFKNFLRELFPKKDFPQSFFFELRSSRKQRILVLIVIDFLMIFFNLISKASRKSVQFDLKKPALVEHAVRFIALSCWKNWFAVHFYLFYISQAKMSISKFHIYI